MSNKTLYVIFALIILSDSALASNYRLLPGTWAGYISTDFELSTTYNVSSINGSWIAQFVGASGKSQLMGHNG